MRNVLQEKSEHGRFFLLLKSRTGAQIPNKHRMQIILSWKSQEEQEGTSLYMLPGGLGCRWQPVALMNGDNNTCLLHTQPAQSKCSEAMPVYTTNLAKAT